MVSSIGATAIPCRAKILASYFMFWPTLRTPGSSSTGFRIASASSWSIWPSTRVAAPNRSPRPATWPSGR